MPIHCVPKELGKDKERLPRDVRHSFSEVGGTSVGFAFVSRTEIATPDTQRNRGEYVH